MLNQYFPYLLAALAILAAVSFAISPRTQTADGFFGGLNEAGKAPGVLTLVLSQVTTWIFARSLMNAAILGYYYGIAGTVAYAAYYGSFLTGWLIVDRLRFRHGAHNVQSFLVDRFGPLGSITYNFVISLRLVSEVFANLLVVGIVFGAANTLNSNLAIAAVTAVTLIYSMTGGLRASLRTDVLQMVLTLIMIIALFITMVINPAFNVSAILNSSPTLTDPGYVLLVVAVLQIWSYPLHDPVMIDRGFIGDRAETRRSFLHAFWVSVLCIMAFGLLGVFAGENKLADEAMITAIGRLLGDPAMVLLAAVLVISAASTLDSTFSSVSKLVVRDMGLVASTPANGRIAMALFAAAGILLTWFGPSDLFAAVAVSGVASLFLTPVIVFTIWNNREVATWSYGVAFVAAIAGAVLYFLESSGYTTLVSSLPGLGHKYRYLLVITAGVLGIGFVSFWAGLVELSRTSASQRR